MTPRSVAAFVPDLPKDVVLDRVGVLELVDQGEAVAFAKQLGESKATRAAQRRSQLAQQVVEEEQVPLGSAPGRLGTRRQHESAAQRERLPLAHGGERVHGLRDCVEEREDGILERRALLLGALHDRCRRELREAVRKLDRGHRSLLGSLEDPLRQEVELGQPALLDRRDLVGGTAEIVLSDEQVGDRSPSRAPLPGPLAQQPRHPLARHGGLGLRRVGQGCRHDRHLVVRSELAQDVPVERLGLELPALPGARQQPLDQARVGPGEPPYPEVVRQRPFERLRLLDQLRVEGQAALEGVLLERPLAEAMDREDRGLVEFLQRAPQRIASPRRLALRPRRERQRSKPLALGILGRRVDGGDRLLDAVSYALPQLSGRRRRVGHDQDLGRREILLDEQAQVEGRERIGLARPRARLDQRRPRQLHLPCVELGDHARWVFRSASIGSKNSAAT